MSGFRSLVVILAAAVSCFGQGIGILGSNSYPFTGSVWAIRYTVVDLQSGSPKQGVLVTAIIPSPTLESGDHFHDDGSNARPNLVMEDASLNACNPCFATTNAAGQVVFTALIPFYAGTYTINASCTSCVNDTTTKMYARDMNPSQVSSLRLSPWMHVVDVQPQAHLGMDFMALHDAYVSLNAIAQQFYYATTPHKKLYVYRGSMRLGGINDDLGGFWTPAIMDQHRWGSGMDVGVPHSAHDQALLLTIADSIPGFGTTAHCLTDLVGGDGNVPEPGLWHIDCGGRWGTKEPQ
jgi:hypothetical protein